MTKCSLHSGREELSFISRCGRATSLIVCNSYVRNICLLSFNHLFIWSHISVWLHRWLFYPLNYNSVLSLLLFINILLQNCSDFGHWELFEVDCSILFTYHHFFKALHYFLSLWDATLGSDTFSLPLESSFVQGSLTPYIEKDVRNQDVGARCGSRFSWC